MNIILFGPPGAGKGTQADKIVNEFDFHKVSTGDLLREQISNNTEIGIKIKEIIDKGQFVSDEIIDNLIKKILSNKKYFNRLVFDGYPRNLNQAKTLEYLVKKNNQKITCVLSLNVERDLIVKRVLGRQSCNKCGQIFNEYFRPSSKENHQCGDSFLVKRPDDNEETILKRFETYQDKTLPILNFYKNLNLLHEVNGKVEIDQIFKEIREIIASLETWLCNTYLYK